MVNYLSANVTEEFDMISKKNTILPHFSFKDGKCVFISDMNCPNDGIHYMNYSYFVFDFERDYFYRFEFSHKNYSIKDLIRFSVLEPNGLMFNEEFEEFEYARGSIANYFSITAKQNTKKYNILYCYCEAWNCLVRNGLVKGDLI